MNTTAKQARETKIFVINNESVLETNLYAFVMQSAEDTTSPRGVCNKLHIRENEGAFELWSWGVRGNNPFMLESFDTENEADDALFQRVSEVDFMNDDQRDTTYYMTFEEAEKAIIANYAEINNIDMHVAISIFNHKAVAEIIKEARRSVVLERAKKENERINNLATIYSKMIDKQNESYKETCTRLSNAIGQKIEKQVFHTAVKMIRNGKNN